MKFVKTLVTGLGVLAVTVRASQEASAETLKFATLAPKQSVWGQVFQVWEKAVAKKSDGKLELVFDYNGSAGDEGAMVGKIKAGQLDGAAMTAVGLSKYYKPTVAMQMPGVLTDWSKVDKALAAKGDEFNKGLRDAGAANLGWGFVGLAHVFTKGDGSTVMKPSDLKSRKPYMWKDDMIAPITYQIIGATPVGLNVPEVLPNLKTGAVDTVIAPALAVEQLQWAGQLNSMGNEVTGAAIGAIVINSKRLDALPGDMRELVQSTGKLAAGALTEKIKEADKAAFTRLSGKLKTYDLDSSGKEAFTSTFKQVRERLAQGTFSADLVKAIEAAGGL